MAEGRLMNRGSDPLARGDAGHSLSREDSSDARPTRALPLSGFAIRVDACGGIARVVLTQRFTNHHPDPLVVAYRFPLPVDAALTGYGFSIGGSRVSGRVEPRAAARQQFEEALLDGRSAGVVEQDGADAFSLELGPIPPGAELVAELRLDQKLVWLEEGAWEWRFPTTATPRYVAPRASRPPEGPTFDLGDPARLLEIAVLV